MKIKHIKRQDGINDMKKCFFCLLCNFNVFVIFSHSALISTLGLAPVDLTKSVSVGCLLKLNTN